MKYYIGIDLGGTNIKVGIVDQNQKIIRYFFSFVIFLLPITKDCISPPEQWNTCQGQRA